MEKKASIVFLDQTITLMIRKYATVKNCVLKKGENSLVGGVRVTLALFVWSIWFARLLNAPVFDLQILEDAGAGVAKHVVRGGQKAGGAAVAESRDQVRVRFVVAVVDPIGARPVAAAGADVVSDASVIGELNVDRLLIRARQRLWRKFANEFRFGICSQNRIGNHF